MIMSQQTLHNVQSKGSAEDYATEVKMEEFIREFRDYDNGTSTKKNLQI